MAKLALFFLTLTIFSSALLYESAADEESNARNVRRTSISVSDYKIRRLTLQYIEENTQPIIDGCDRDEAFYPGDGECYHLLTKGPCSIDKHIVLSRSNNSGICAPRFCLPDRIYLPEEQLCFDHRDESLCPPGREPRVDAYGEPICQCKFGTFDVLGESVENSCAPFLARTSRCPDGQVLWSKGFGQPLECLPDPCGGANLRRGHYDLPFIPLPNGRCFQLGSEDICPPMTWYALSLDTMRGVCASLEDAGYEFFSENTYYDLIKFFGLPIARDFISLDSFKSERITNGNPDSSDNSIMVTGGTYGDSQNSGLNVYGTPGSTNDPSEQYKSQRFLTGSKKNPITKLEGISGSNPLSHASADGFLRKVLELIENGPHNRSQRQRTGILATTRLPNCAQGFGGKCGNIITAPSNNLSRRPIRPRF